MTTALAEQPGPPAKQVDAKTLSEVRKNVAEVLQSSPTYWAMPQDQRKAVANAMVRIGTYLVDGEQPSGQARATALAGTQQPPPPPDTATACCSQPRPTGSPASLTGTAPAG